jgi:hypothetical protein
VKVRRIPPRARDLGKIDPRGDACHNRTGNLLLQVEHVGLLPVVTLGPKMVVCHRVNELCRHPDAVADPANAAFEHVAHPEVSRHLCHIERLALLEEGRVAGDDRKLAKARKFGNNVLRQTIGRVFLIRIAAHVLERQHGDGGFVGKRKLWSLARGRNLLRCCCALMTKPRTPHPYRLRDILQALRTQILEGNIDFAANLAIRVIGNADAARLGNPLKPRRNVDAIAKNIIVIDDDVADVDADAKFYPLILW